MKAQETSFGQLIGGPRQFQIPLYQRTYSWHGKHWRRLWDDVLEQADAMRQEFDVATHFLGSVVLSPSPLGTAGGVNRQVVVDGQQRVTTLMLMLCALRDHLTTQDPEQKGRFNFLYLTNPYQEDLDRYRLVPTQADRDAFFACIDGKAVGFGSIGDAYRFFRGAIQDLDDPTDDDIRRIEAALRDRLTIVEIVTQDDDNVYRIFESLNDTGLRLTQADLLRNYLFMRLPTRSEKVYDALWSPMQERLGPDLELLFFLDLVLREGERAKRGDVYRAQKERLKGYDEATIEEEIVAFERRSRLLRRILEPAEEPDPAARATFERFRLWGAQTAYPLALRLIEILEQGKATAEQVAQALSYAESFIVRRMLCNIPTNNLNRIFSSVAAQLRDDRPVDQAVREALSGPRRFWPTDRALSEAIHTKPFAWYGRFEQRLIVLRRLEERLSGEPLPADADLALTYVMPERASADWLAELAEGEPFSTVPSELHSLLVHTLGNVTLGVVGAQLDADRATRRQQLRERANLAMNYEVADAPRWTAQAVRSRADRLAATAAVIWPGPMAGALEEPPDEDRRMLRQVLTRLPAGRWTTAEDLAALGLDPRILAEDLVSGRNLQNTHRVLTRDGMVAPDRRMPGGDGSRDIHDVLRSEGIRFDSDLRADRVQRLTSYDLADLVDMSADDRVPSSGTTTGHIERSESFLRQLAEHQSLTAQAGVLDLLRTWCELDGAYLDYGPGRQTTCFLELAGPPGAGYSYRPFTIYPHGWVEVTFKWGLSKKPPFDSPRYRDEFRRRCNEAPGVSISPAQLEKLPSIKIQVLADPTAKAALFAALKWFVASVDEWMATRG